jgi:hypothetical protein
MDVRALTVKAVRDGPVCTVILCGDRILPRLAGSWNRRPWPSMTGPSDWF